MGPPRLARIRIPPVLRIPPIAPARISGAARLESLNKLLDTSVLLADSTRRAVGQRFVCRCLGSFIVAGKTTPELIHELVSPAGAAPADLAWLDTWEEAMRALRQGDFPAVPRILREVVWQRNGKDGPAEFYLRHLAKLEKEGQLSDWTGVVRLMEK